MQFTIYDGNNWLRRLLEKPPPVGIMSPIFNAYNKVIAQRGLKIVVWDGPGSSKPRKELYPEYKAKRPPTKDSFFVAMDMMKEALYQSGVIQCLVPRYEADDVIASLVGKYRRDHEIYIDSMDKDILALGVPCGADRGRGLPCLPGEVQLYKTLVGDSSDNIPGLNGFGPKSWSKLSDIEKLDLMNFFEGRASNLPALKDHKGLRDKIKDARETLYKFWTIVDFWHVTDEKLDTYTIMNQHPDAEAALKALGEHVR